MDDTTRGIGSAEDPAHRRAEYATGRSTDATRGYATDATEPDPDVDRRTSEIRRDIEQTRGEMAETIEAIEEKLRPGNIVSSATERVKDAATERVRNMKHAAEDAYGRMRSGTASSGFVGDIRQNPIPALMIGVGTAWLLMHRRSSAHYDRGSTWNTSSTGAQDASYNRVSGEEGLRSAAMEDDLVPAYTDTDYSRQGRYRPYGEGGADGGGLMERIKNNPVPAALTAVGLGWLFASSGTPGTTMSSVAESTRHITSRAQEYTRDATSQVRYRRRRAQNQLQRMARENPLMVGAGALLLGSAVGLAIPETRRENDLLGEARDSMLDKAQEMARNAASRAQETVADLAGDAASRVGGGKQE